MRKLSIHILCSTLLLLPTASIAADQFSVLEREINHELAQFRKLEKQWAKVEENYGAAEGRYKAASRLVKRCNRGTWSVLFKDVFKELDASRKNLEEARSATNSANKIANSMLKNQNRNIRILEASYSGKVRDGAYWEKMNTIVGTISTDYADVITDIVIPGYAKYINGIDELTDSYNFAAKDCNRPLPFNPLRQFFKDVLGIVVGKISIVNALADEILESVPDKLKKKS